MRLIDVDKITDKEIRECLGKNFISCMEDVKILLSECPTAYDMDMVVDRLEFRKKRAESLRDEGESEYFEGQADAFERTIEIVKGGGIE